MVIDYEIDDWRPGFGYKWGDALPDAYFSGCSLGPYRETIRAHRAGRLRLRADGRAAGRPARHRDRRHRAPARRRRSRCVGPNGERVSTPEDLMPVEAKPFFLMKNPHANLTQIAISQPSRRAAGA